MTDIPRTYTEADLEAARAAYRFLPSEEHAQRCERIAEALGIIKPLSAPAPAVETGGEPVQKLHKLDPQDLAGRLEAHECKGWAAIDALMDEAAARIRTLEGAADMIAEEREAWKARALTAESQLERGVGGDRKAGFRRCRSDRSGVSRHGRGRGWVGRA